MRDRLLQNHPARRALIAAIFVGLAGVQIAHAGGPVNVAISNAGTTSFASAAYATDSDAQGQIDLALNGDADGTGGGNGFRA